MEFKNLTDAKDLKSYLLKVLSRTGGKSADSLFLYHYSSISVIASIFENGYIWLSSPNSMNDQFEREVINSVNADRQLFFTSFSRSEENIAMYKMYSSFPNGAMLSISYVDARAIIENLEKSDAGNMLVHIVRNDIVTDDIIEADVFWAAVAYKSLHSNKLRSGNVINKNIEKPFKKTRTSRIYKTIWVGI